MSPALMLRRLAITLLALWLPAATGVGGRAAALAVQEASTFVGVVMGKRHLSCHGPANNDCCCREGTQLRPARCGCHDGASSSAAVVHDPMLAYAVCAGMAPGNGSRMKRPADEAPPGRALDSPDPPPPRPLRSVQA